jgi:hypothetical protein
MSHPAAEDIAVAWDFDLCNEPDFTSLLIKKLASNPLVQWCQQHCPRAFCVIVELRPNHHEGSYLDSFVIHFRFRHRDDAMMFKLTCA